MGTALPGGASLWQASQVIAAPLCFSSRRGAWAAPEKGPITARKVQKVSKKNPVITEAIFLPIISSFSIAKKSAVENFLYIRMVNGLKNGDCEQRKDAANSWDCFPRFAMTVLKKSAYEGRLRERSIAAPDDGVLSCQKTGIAGKSSALTDRPPSTRTHFSNTSCPFM
jgi:hypothetical protein